MCSTWSEYGHFDLQQGLHLFLIECPCLPATPAVFCLSACLCLSLSFSLFQVLSFKGFASIITSPCLHASLSTEIWQPLHGTCRCGAGDVDHGCPSGEKKRPSQSQQKQTLTGKLPASWSLDLLYFKGWRFVVGGWWRLMAVGGWRLVPGGATTTGPDATHPPAICQNLGWGGVGAGGGGGHIQGPGPVAPPGGWWLMRFGG